MVGLKGDPRPVSCRGLPDGLRQRGDQLVRAQVVGEVGVAAVAPRPGVDRHTVLPLMVLLLAYNTQHSA